MRCSSQFKLSCARAQQPPQPYLRAYYARSRTYARTSSAIYARTFRMLRPYPLRGTPVGVNLYARTCTRTTPVERFRFYRIYRTCTHHLTTHSHIHALTTSLPTPTYMHSPPHYPLPHTCTHHHPTHTHIHALTTSLPTPTYMHSQPHYPLPHTCTHHLTTHSHIHALTTSLPTPTYMHSPPHYSLPHTCTHHLPTHSHIHALPTLLPTPTYMHSPPYYPLPHTCTPHLTTHSPIHALTIWVCLNLDHSALFHFMSSCGASPEFVYKAAVVPNDVNSCVAMVPSGYLYVNGV